MSRRGLSLVVVALLGCGSSSGDAGDAGEAADAATLAEARFCVTGCAGPEDCAYGPAGGVSTAEHYECVEGACRWLGCFSTEECIETMGAPGFVCGQDSLFPVPRCLEDCAGPEDCGPLFGCVDGACRYEGCSGDGDCALFGADRVCAGGECRKRCEAPPDCAGSTQPPPNDAENYACVEGSCVWLGCAPTGCDALLGDLEYVCEPARV